MKRNKLIYSRWLRVLFLSFALLVGGGGWMAWGQDAAKPVIELKFSDEHDNVHTEEKIIYVDPAKPRVLSIPELNINNRGYNKDAKRYDNTYNWFVHWYVKNGNSKGKGKIKHEQRTVAYTKVGDRGGQLGVCNTNVSDGNNKTYITHDYFVSVKNTDGLIWSDRLKSDKIVVAQKNGELPGGDYLDPDGLYQYGLGIDASTIAYTGFVEGDVVYCDVSIYKDGKWVSSAGTDIAGVYTEPTLLKRYKYVIKNAHESPSFSITEAISYDVYYPKNASSINLSMPYTPDNYFWQEGSNIHQGAEFLYRINGKGDFKNFHLVTKTATLDLQQNQKIKKEDLEPGQDNVVEIKVKCATHASETSDVLVKYTFHPIDNAEFKLEGDLVKGENDDRWPRGNTKKYQQIGIVDFDQKEPGKDLPETIQVGDNMSDSPLGSFNESQTSYGFLRKNGASLLEDRKSVV